MGMQELTIGSMTNNTGAPNSNNYYNDYSANFYAASPSGSFISYYVKVGPSNTTQVAIYIDWNNDGVFNTTGNEYVFNTGTISANGTQSGSFYIPAGLNAGIYRMRVVGDYGSVTVNPCALTYTGEVEDYNFVINSPSLDVAALGTLDKIEVGNNNLFVKVANLTSNTTITSYDIGYRIDNGPVHTESLSSQNLAASSFVNKSFSTPLNMPTPGEYTLKVWARNPNGNGAGISSNDTLKKNITVCYALNGLYTINPSGSGSTNFTSFQAAIDRLITCGVSGPVTFNVAAGTYNEQVILPEIDGASATNTITFDGGSGNSLTRIVQYNTTDLQNKHVFRFDGASYMEFRNLTIRTTGANYGWPIHIKAGSHHLNFTHNIIQTPDYSTTVGNTYFIPVCISNSNQDYYVNTSNVHDITIDSNSVYGGYYAISMYGAGSSSNNYDIWVRNNNVESFYYSGFYVVNLSNVHLKYNRFTQKTSNTTGGYGFYLNSVNASGSYTNEIIGNEVLRSFQYGCYMTSVNNNGVRGKFYNNIVGVGLLNATSYGAYVNSSSNFDFWHNTFTNSSVSTGANSSALYINNSSSSDIRNNIFHVGTVGSTALPIKSTSQNQLATLDNNNYFKAGADKSAPLVQLDDNTVVSGNNIKGRFGYNATVYNEEPAFISATNLRLSSSVLSPFGEGNLGVNEDVNGDARCVIFPTIGADESAYTVANNPNIIVDDSVFTNSPTSIYNSAAVGEPKLHLWTIDGGVASYNTVHIKHTFAQTGAYDVKLQTTSCTGVDTAYKRIDVVNPTQAPISAFVSTQNAVDQGYPMSLIDQSTGGPTSWVWTITPSTGVQFVNGSNVQNPEVIFNEVGSYEVCLIASNAAGQGNTLCRTDYIQVGEATNMCANKIVSKTSTGKIFDTGGKFGDYANGSNCGFLIDPCASSVTLKFESFGLDVGDYLRVYDGSDDSGIPLHTGAGFSGNIIPTDLTASTGKMYVQFVTNGTGTLGGFEASWTSVAKSFSAPAAAFRAPDTLYTGTNFTFISNSTGIDPSLTWDFDNDGVIDATGSIASYTFSSPGTYLVRLAIEDCGGMDGAVKSILVIDPNFSPTPDFVTDYRTISNGETVRFYDRSTQAPDTWEWSFNPNTVTFLEGTDQYSQNPVVRFDAVGNYDVTLKASNSIGLGTVTKSGAIRVVEYCYPGAGLNTDLGITRVTFAGIDNVSQVGPVTYSNYTLSVQSAAVQKGSKYPITVQRSTNNEDMTRKVWIDYDGNGVFSASEEVLSHTPDKSLSWTDTITIPQNVSDGSTRMRIGTSYGITNNSPCGVNPYGEFEDYTITIYENLTRPVITIIGQEVVTIEVGSNYNDSGATALDDVDGNLTSQIITTDNLNTQAVGTYYYRYNVSDNNGNSAEETRIIHVTPDVTAPVLTLNGANPYPLVLGSQFIDPGATAVDSYDGVIPSNQIQVTGFVNALQIGQYVLTYTVYDQAGNMTSTTRTVNVGDTTVPQIFLKGADTIFIALGASFNDPGALVVDNNTSNLSYNVDLSVIDNTTVGFYTLTYTAVDSSGNIAVPVNRVVGVKDYTAPSLQLLGDTVIMEVHTSYNEPGYLVADNYDATVPVVISGTVDTAKTGLYILFYEATDAGGNSSPLLYRIVQVLDTKAPVITLQGDKIQTICRWANYTDPGYTVSDNYDLSVEVEVTSTVVVETEGLYTIRYVARDKAGNNAITQERLIRVVACVTGIEDQLENTLKVYPNPSTGMINLQAEGLENTSLDKIVIRDIHGKELTVKTSLEGDKITLDMSQVVPGTYFVQVLNGESVITRKIQIIR